MKRLYSLFFALITTLVVGSTVLAHADWSAPGDWFVEKKVGIGTMSPEAELDVRGNLLLDNGGDPAIIGGAGDQELNRYLRLANSPAYQSAMGLKAGGILVSDQYSYANPGKDDLVVKGSVGIGIKAPQARLEVAGGPEWRAGWRKALRLGHGDLIEFGTAKETAYGIGGSDGGSLVFFAANSTNLGADQTGSMALDASGNLKVSGATTTEILKVNGATTTEILHITGGSDLAEPFAVSGAALVEPGMVVAIAPENPGQLRVTDSAYDPMVAGIISGAGGIQPGLIMQQEELIQGETHPVALTGKVYVKAVGPVRVGDLLTSSDIPGHAMAASDRELAFGTTIGKAMSALDEETGLVLLLVALQ